MQVAVNRKDIKFRPDATRVIARFLYMDDERAIYVIAGLLIIYSMNSNLSPVNLYELKTKLRNKYTQLTDADLFSSEGNENDMLRMIEYKLRKTKQEMREIIAGL